jgi:predicted DNA-binding transcriptional regulator YafY
MKVLRMTDQSSEADVAAGLRWGVERRLWFIDLRLFWERRINRADLMDYFGVSMAQASADLSRYQDLAPGNLAYDKRAKTYVASPTFRSRFAVPDADAYLNTLLSVAAGIVSRDRVWISKVPAFDAVPVLRRAIDPDRLRAVLAAISGNRALHIRYQSMSRAEPSWRWISPHALAFDGFRWHARAFCHIDRVFKDFVLSRALEVGDTALPEGNADDDSNWHRTVTFRIGPHPRLTPAQRKAIELDYGMTEGRLEIEVRAAFAYYVRKRLGLDRPPEEKRPQDQQIVLQNAAEIDAACGGAPVS